MWGRRQRIIFERAEKVWLYQTEFDVEEKFYAAGECVNGNFGRFWRLKTAFAKEALIKR